MSRARNALLLVLLLCLAITVHQIHRPAQADFAVYDTAAYLVHQHRSAAIYDGADTGADPQLKFAERGSAFDRAGRAVGLREVRMYVYPPILADLILPFSFVPEAEAAKMWFVCNVAALLLTVWLILRMLDLGWRSLGGLALLVGVFAMFSTGMCLLLGQITIVLLLLWTAAIFFYQRGWVFASSFMLALAVAIKLTPLLALVPFVIWREWRWLRGFAISMAILVGVVCVLNGPGTLTDYFLHVTPAMSRGIPDLENKSIFSSAAIFYVTLHGGATKPIVMFIPKIVNTLAKVGSLAVVGVSALMLLRLGRGLPMRNRVVSLALFAMLSAAIAPVSWKHAFAVAFLGLALLWDEALRQRVRGVYLAVLSLCTVELGSFFFDSAAIKATHGAALGVLMFVAPGAAFLLTLVQLRRMGQEGHEPALQGAAAG